MVGSARVAALAFVVCSLSSLAAEPARVCPRSNGYQVLDPDSAYRCAGLPLEVNFPRGSAPFRHAQGEVTTLDAKVPKGRLLFVHRPFPWGGLGKEDPALDQFIQTVITSLGLPGVRTSKPVPLTLAGAEHARAAKFELRQGELHITGEVRVFVARTYLVAQAVMGRAGSPYAEGGEGATAYFQSFTIAPRPASEGFYALEGVGWFPRPAESFEITAPSAADPVFHLSNPAGLWMVRNAGPLQEDSCESRLEREASALRDNPDALPGLQLDVGATGMIDLQASRALELRGRKVAGRDGAASGHLVSQLFCVNNRLLQSSLITPTEDPAAAERLKRFNDTFQQGTRLAPANAPDAKVLRVALSGNYWPLHGGEGDRRYGLEADLARALAMQLGMKVQFLGKKELGVASLDAVAQGKADLALSSITPTGERLKLVDFTAPYLNVPYKVAKKVTTAEPDGYAFQGKKIGVPKGTLIDAVSYSIREGTQVDVPSFAAGLKLLKKGKIDFLVGEDIALAELSDPTLDVAKLPIGASPLAIAVQRGTGARFNAALGQVSSELARFEELYRPTEAAPPNLVLAWGCDVLDVSGLRIDAGAAKISGIGPPGAGRKYSVLWQAPGALPVTWVFGLYPDEAADLCVSGPYRLTPRANPAANKALAAALRQMRKTTMVPGDYTIYDTPEAWFVLANGGHLTAVPWERVSACDESPCSRRGYVMVAIKGGAFSTGLVVTERAEVELETPTEETQEGDQNASEGEGDNPYPEGT